MDKLLGNARGDKNERKTWTRQSLAQVPACPNLYIPSVSWLAGEAGDVALGGVEGGEGNSVGWREGGEEGSCLVGAERGKDTAGLMGEACFVGEEDRGVAWRGAGSEEEVWPSWAGDDGEGE